VSLVPENTEDMWHAYNLISEGDFVSCSTIRYIQVLYFLNNISFNFNQYHRVNFIFHCFLEKCKWNQQLVALTVIESELL